MVVIKVKCFTKKMTRGENFIERGKCKNNHCSSMSNSADLNSKCDILNLHYICPNFTPHQYMLESGSVKSNLKSIFRRTQTT